MEDVYIKDEGDFVGVIFQTLKAKSIANEQGISNEYTFSNTIYRIDMNIKSLHNLIYILVSHDLSFESEVSIKIPTKRSWYDNKN